MQVVGRILLAMYYKSIKSQVGRMGTTLLLIFDFSVMSRRGVSTSRRQFYMPLSRRDVDLPRCDVNFTCLCHVATWTSHVATSIFTFSATSRRAFSRRDVNLYKPLSRRNVAPNVATSLSYMLSHVATLTRMSRRWLHYSLSRRDVDPHVATWPYFKPKSSSFLALHLTQPTT